MHETSSSQLLVAFGCKPSVKLFCRFLSLASRSLVRRLLLLSGGEAFRFFATHKALPDVISAVIVPHSSQSSPACRTLATGRN